MLTADILPHLRKEIHKIRDEKENIRPGTFDALAYHTADVTLTFLHNAIALAQDAYEVDSADCWLSVDAAPCHCTEGKPYTVRFKGGDTIDDCIYYNGKFFPQRGDGGCNRFEDQPQHFMLT